MAPKQQQGKRGRDSTPGSTSKKEGFKQQPEVDEDTAFPRGGGDQLSKQEREEILAAAAAEVDRDAEAGAVGPQKKKQKGGKGNKGDTQDDDIEGSFLKGAVLAGKVPQYVELLKFKRLVVGMRIWGIVLEVNDKGLQISLPDGLRGKVAPEEACELLHKKGGKEGTAQQGQAPQLTSLFHVGQYVRCVVVGLQHGSGSKGSRGGKVVELSCRLKRVVAPGSVDRTTLVPGCALPAEVRAELDHGWTLGFGHKGHEGFLPRSQHVAAFGEGATLVPGQIQEVVVQSPPDARGVVAVTTHPGAVADALTGEWSGLSLESLLPGSLVNARVRRVQGDGLLVTFLTFFHGTVDPFHLHLPGRAGQQHGEVANTKGFTEGMKVKARILYVNPISKEVGLSLLPHIINRTLPATFPVIGQVFEAARVSRVFNGLGLILELPQEGMDPCPGYCHLANLSEERLPKLDSVFKVGSTLRVRVIGFNLLDGLASVAARKDLVEQQIMKYEDAFPGMPISGTLTSVDDAPGLWVSVSKNVRALVPVLHLPDASSVAKAHSKFKVGQTINGRVLSVDPAAKKMLITLKQGLLTSRLPLITSPMHALPGVKSHAVVTGARDDKGVFLGFFGGVTSLAPTSELGLPPGALPSAYFHPGQVVRARVTSLDNLGRPRCSLKAGKGAATDAANGGEGALQNGTLADQGAVPQVGDVIEAATVKAVMDPSAGSAPRAGHGALILDIPGAPGVSARLDLRGHLADHPAAEAVLKPLLAQQGAKIGPLVVLERLESPGSNNNTLLLSRKPSLVKAARESMLPHSFEEVKEGTVLHGFVANVTHDGVFVRFAGHTTGRAGLSQLADSFVADPRQLFTEGQSVRAQVVTVDAAHSRFSVTLRPSLTASTDASYLASMFSDLEVAEQIRVQQILASPEGNASSVTDWSQLRLGCLTQCQVSEHASYGLVVDLDVHPDLVGVIRPPHYPSAPPPSSSQKTAQPNTPLPAPGTRMQCRVLDVSQAEGIVDLSARPDLLEPVSQLPASAATPSKKKKGSKAGQEANAASGSVGDGQLPCAQGSVQEGMIEVLQGSPANYVVLSFPQLPGAPLACAALTDFNAPTMEASRRAAGLSVGQRVKAVVASHPEQSNGSRLLAAIPSLFGGSGPAGLTSSATEGTPKQSVKPGNVVSVRVTGVGNTQADVVVGKKLAGRLHVSQIRDADVGAKTGVAGGAGVTEQRQQEAGSPATGASGKKRKKSGAGAGAGDACAQQLQRSGEAGDVHLWHGNPLDELSVGQQLEAVVLGRGGSGHHGVLDFSVRPSVLEAARKGQSLPTQPCFGSLQPGMTVGCVVSETADDHAWLALAPGVRGRLHVLDSAVQPQQLAAFSQRFKVGDGVVARVVSVDAKKQMLDLTLLPPLLRGAHLVPAAAVTTAVASGSGVTVASVLPAGSVAMGRLSRVQGGLRAQLGGKLHGTIALPDVHDVYVANALEGLQEGSFVRARVLTCAVEGSGKEQGKLPRVTLSLRPSEGGAVPDAAAAAAARAVQEGAPSAPTVLPADSLTTPGTSIAGYVKRVEARQGMFVALDRTHDARVKMCNLSDGFIEDPAVAFPEGLLVSGRIVAAESTGAKGACQEQQTRLEMTLRSATSSRASAGVRVLSDFREGEVVPGRVKRVEKFGVFVELANSNVSGLAHISELLDTGKVKNIHGLFRPGQLVRAKVTAIDLGAGRMSLTLKPSEVGQPADGDLEDGPASKRQKREAGLDDEMAEAEEEEEHAGRALQGGSSADESEGESEAGSSSEEEGEDARVHQQGADGSVPNVDDLGDSDSDDDQAGAGSNDDDDEDDVASDQEGGTSSEAAAGERSSSVEPGSAGGGASEGGDEGGSGSDEDGAGSSGGSDADVFGGDGGAGVDSGEGDSESEGDEEEGQQAAARAASASAASTAAANEDVGAGWGGGLRLVEEQEQAAGAEHPQEHGPETKVSRHAKKRAKEEKEAAIERAEQARLQGDSAPTSPAEFEVLLRSSPNASYVWIRYMAFLLQLGEVDKARALAQRALDTIYYREEGEKFNVWVAWMNMEAVHGSPNPDEALMATFSRAAPYCDLKQLYMKLLGILRRPSANPGRHELLANTLRTMTKKLSGSAKVWLAAHESILRGETNANGTPDPEGARKLLERALLSLPKHKHIKVIVQAAMHEFKCPGGSAERGRGVLESVLRNNPKRIDLWSLYIDQEVKAGDEGRTRGLFERITSLSLPTKKMKPIFKRWLDWEKRIGDPKRVEAVKQRALEFVNAT